MITNINKKFFTMLCDMNKHYGKEPGCVRVDRRGAFKAVYVYFPYGHVVLRDYEQTTDSEGRTIMRQLPEVECTYRICVNDNILGTFDPTNEMECLRILWYLATGNWC